MAADMRIKECTPEFWDAFVDASPQGTVFNKSLFFSSYDRPVTYLICWKGEEAVSGFGFVSEGQSIRLMPFSVCGGIIFKDLSGYKNYRRNETVFASMEAWADYLFNHYQEINFLNHWDIVDMRAFDWLNYHERDKGHYKISVRYTSLVDISRPEDMSGFSKGRVSDLKKKCETHHVMTRDEEDVSVLDRLHKLTFTRQGIERSSEEGKNLLRICQNLLREKFGRLFVTYVDNEPATASFFAFDRFRAYYLFSGMDDRFRDLAVGAKNMCHCFTVLSRECSIHEVDMVGINSPQRGAYKLSYGGNVVPYFRIEKVMPR